MSGFEAVGVAIGLFSTLLSTSHGTVQSYTAFWWRLRTDIYEFGLQAPILRITRPEVWQVIDRVRKHILLSDKDPLGEALSFRESYVASFNMIGVAGAIVAQIAITALSLSQLENTHWTAEAAFVSSLIAGSFSVYFACRMQLTLGSLHDGFAMIDWLTTQPSRNGLERILFGAGGDVSLNSALLLVSPVLLLNWALSSLLIGIGIYYGFVYTKHLSTLPGKNANLAVLLVFVIFTFICMYSFFSPLTFKDLENSGDMRSMFLEARAKRAAGPDELKKGSGSLDEESKARPRVHAARSDDDQSDAVATSAAVAMQNSATDAGTVSTAVVDALKASIAAQKASLRAQEALLKLYIPESAG